MKKEKTVWLLIRIGIAFAFLYPAVKAHIDPDSWLGYFPAFIKNMGIPEAILLGMFSVLHAVIALWILWGKKLFIPAVVGALFLAGVIVTNASQMDIIFRDISLLFIMIAIAVHAFPERLES